MSEMKIICKDCHVNISAYMNKRLNGFCRECFKKHQIDLEGFL